MLSHSHVFFPFTQQHVTHSTPHTASILKQVQLDIGLSWLKLLLLPTTPLCLWPMDFKPIAVLLSLCHWHIICPITTSNSNRLDTLSVSLDWNHCCLLLPLFMLWAHGFQPLTPHCHCTVVDSTHSACPPNQSGLTHHWSVLVGITIASCYPLFVPLAHGFQPPHLNVIALSLTPLILHALQTNQVWHVVGLSWLESLLLPATPSLDVIFLLYHLIHQENSVVIKTP